MANELRVRSNFIDGLVENNPLAIGGTTLTSAALSGLAAIGATQHAVIVLDPDALSGAPEIIYVTAHTGAATTATIVRAQEGTTARAHTQDTPWVHTPTAKDYDALGGGVGLIGLCAFAHASDTDLSTSSTSSADVDATNLVVTFTGPPSGKVLVRLTATAYHSASVSHMQWSVRSAGADVSGPWMVVQGTDISTQSKPMRITGLTPGTSYTYTWGWKVSAGTGHIRYGPLYGQCVMEVWAVNL